MSKKKGTLLRLNFAFVVNIVRLYKYLTNEKKELIIMLMLKIKNSVVDFILLLYPELCQACSNPLFRKEKIICISCLYKLPRTNFHLNADNTLSRVFWGRIQIESIASFLFFSKEGKVQNLMHAFKYKSNEKIGQYLGYLYALDLKKNSWLNSIDVIVPVPLHPKKHKIRGYNQSEEFAHGLAEINSIPINTGIIHRMVESETQTKKSRFKRWKNVNTIFQLLDDSNIQGKHILLVDDVITTGATIEACTQELLKIKDVKISIASLAFAAN
jgi:ComF family protein